MLTTLLIIAGAIIGLAVLYQILFEARVVRDYEIGLLYTNGRYVRRVKPGRHLLLKMRNSITVLDMRSQNTAVASQEVLTADNVGVRAGVVVSYKIVEPERAVHTVDNYTGALNYAVQLALQSVVGGNKLADLLATRAGISERIENKVRPDLLRLGIKLHAAKIRDLTVGSEARKTFGGDSAGPKRGSRPAGKGQPEQSQP